MSKPLTHQLFQLIKSLSKSEKRHFRLYATRNSSEKELKFLSLFSALDAQAEYDEPVLLAKLDGVNKRQLSNLKAHLYQQILVSLRLLHRRHGDLELREMLDFASVLYDKGLYLQSLDQLTKARNLAQQRGRLTLFQEIIEFEKRIESRHITHSHAQRAEELIRWGREARAQLQGDEAWSDVALEMYGLYLRIGHVKNHDEYAYVSDYFLSRLPKSGIPLSFFGQVFRAQAYVWFHFIQQDWIPCYRHARTWVSLFQQHPAMQEQETNLYIKGIHNLLSVLYYNMDVKRHTQYLHQLQEVIAQYQEKFTENARIYASIYVSLDRIDHYFLTANFTAGIEAIPEIEAQLNQFNDRIDGHRRLIFRYKFACLHFAKGQYRECIQYLQQIVNEPKTSLREDIQVFARILKLIAHYEVGDHDLVDAQIRSVYRYLLKFENMQEVQKAVMLFLKNSVYMDRQQLTPHFKQLQEQLEQIARNPYQRRPFIYLDLYTYLRTKIEGLSMAEAVTLRVSQRDY